MTSPAPPSFELIFVHGTWARDSAYGQRDSFFVQKLMEFAGEAACYRRFTWSGRNTVSARERGAKEFAKFVAKLPPKPPNTKRLALCHSHGGSVVLMAFLDEATSSSFDGVVSIGTPFLHVYRLKDVEPTIVPPFSLMTASLAWIALALSWRFSIEALNFLSSTVLAIVSTIHSAIDWVASHPILAVISIIGAMIALLPAIFLLMLAEILPVMLAMKYAKWQLGRDPQKAGDPYFWPPFEAVWRIKERCRLPHSAPVPTLLLRVPADEAYGALIFSRFVSFLVVQLYGFAILAMTVAIRKSQTLSYLGRPIGSLFGSVRFLLRCFLSLPVAVCAGAALLLFGREFFRVGGQVLISAESTPPGTWQVTVLPPLDRQELRLANRKRFEDLGSEDFTNLHESLLREWKTTTVGIIHSRGYTDPRAISLITEWMSGLP